MHINRPTNFQQLMELSISDLARLDTGLTDVTLVPDSGEKVRTLVSSVLVIKHNLTLCQVKVHGFLLSAASPFLRDVLSSTFSPNLEYTILLPGECSDIICDIINDVYNDYTGIHGSVVSCLTQMLYGASVLSCRDTLVQLYR